MAAPVIHSGGAHTRKRSLACLRAAGPPCFVPPRRAASDPLAHPRRPGCALLKQERAPCLLRASVPSCFVPPRSSSLRPSGSPTSSSMCSTQGASSDHRASVPSCFVPPRSSSLRPSGSPTSSRMYSTQGASSDLRRQNCVDIIPNGRRHRRAAPQCEAAQKLPRIPIEGVSGRLVMSSRRRKSSEYCTDSILARFVALFSSR
jgi:hypothetical protein